MDSEQAEASRRTIYDAYERDRQAHGECPTCRNAHDKKEMCPAGRARYVEMLNEFENLFVKEGRERVELPRGKRHLWCTCCGSRRYVPAEEISPVWVCEPCR